jgi:hypothetical protein
MITQAKLKEFFTYNEDGTFTRNSTGKVVKCSITKGQRYLRIGIEGKPCSLHRMIFLYHHGYLPKVTDHIDGDRYNNRIENLREVTQQENCLNSKHRTKSKSPYKNVYLQPPTKKFSWKRNWVVSLMVKGKRIYVGSFEDLELANLVAHEARAKYHGVFARNF